MEPLEIGEVGKRVERKEFVHFTPHPTGSPVSGGESNALAAIVGDSDITYIPGFRKSNLSHSDRSNQSEVALEDILYHSLTKLDDQSGHFWQS